MKILNYISIKYFNPYLFLLFSILILSCNAEDDTPNFSDDTNLRLKSVSSYTSVNPSMVFTYSFLYDTDNRLVHVESNSLGSTWDLKYDDNGRLIQAGDYQYYYNTEGKIYKIKNDNLVVASGKYDSTMVNYTQGKISSIKESFTGEYSRKTYLTDISFNNKNQLILAVKTEKSFFFETGQEYIDQIDKETYSYDADANIQKIITEQDFDSNDGLEIEKTYAFDNYNNPIKLIQKSTNIIENPSLVYLGKIASKNSFFAGGTTIFNKSNFLSFSSIPLTSDQNYVHYEFRRNYVYNKYGYPISAEETETLVNQNIEYSTFLNWEYEEY